MTWLTVPEPPLALRPIQPHSRSNFPHMALIKVVAIIRVCIVLPRKKLRNVKAARKTLRVKRKNHILRSLSGPGIGEVQPFGIYNLPFSDIRPKRPGRFFDRLTTAVYERPHEPRQNEVQRPKAGKILAGALNEDWDPGIRQYRRNGCPAVCRRRT